MIPSVFIGSATDFSKVLCHVLIRLDANSTTPLTLSLSPKGRGEGEGVRFKVVTEKKDAYSVMVVFDFSLYFGYFVLHFKRQPA